MDVLEQIKPTRWSPLVFLVFQLAVIAVLVVGMLYTTDSGSSPPAYSWDHVVPLWVPWGGALGGAAISLVGVAGHGHDWNGPRYAYWHLARPVLGMITGTVAVLALLFVLKGIAPDVIPTSQEAYTAGGVAVMFVISFVVGYREETFRDLVKRVVDVLLGPGDKAAAQRLALVPDAIALECAAGSTTPVTGAFTLFNDTKDTFDLATATLAISATPEFTAAWVDSTPLPPNGSRGITVTWTPGQSPAASTQVLTVGVGGYTVTGVVRATLG